ncbi:hypothetical protein Cgig2_014860 [Carnegiea gigantea]|uniref:ABC transporter domain-containing protein n=1 Tax=Carnegiea gigantea TaxID=171969 RepID=A0A9Q1L082_9CARY|nr:hypothetical protein Cgig2_014860 [Carnegiea gigantea]
MASRVTMPCTTQSTIALAAHVSGSRGKEQPPSGRETQPPRIVVHSGLQLMGKHHDRLQWRLLTSQVVMPTVEADVAFGLGKFDLTYEEVKSRVVKALDAVDMSEYLQRPVQTLSGGQKQRVAIAGALAEACKVLLLDELTTFLDENDQIGVIKAVKNSLASSRDVTAFWVTHRLEELEYADGAIYMEDGRVVMDGDPATILDFINSQQALYINQINS